MNHTEIIDLYEHGVHSSPIKAQDVALCLIVVIVMAIIFYFSLPDSLKSNIAAVREHYLAMDPKIHSTYLL